MPKVRDKEPDITVRERVEVDLSKEEVDRALRHWLESRIVPDRAPRAKEGTIHVSFSCGEDEFLGVRLTYEPEPRT